MHRKALGCAALKIPELAEGFSCPARARARRDGGGHPWLSLWESCRRQPTERAPLKKGVIKGGGIASPFGIKLYKTVPLPRLRGKIYLHGMDAGGGGERAPVALCREPVSAPASVGAERSPPATSARAGRRDGGGLHPGTVTAPKIPERPSAEGFSCPARARARQTGRHPPARRETR